MIETLRALGLAPVIREQVRECYRSYQSIEIWTVAGTLIPRPSAPSRAGLLGSWPPATLDRTFRAVGLGKYRGKRELSTL